MYLPHNLILYDPFPKISEKQRIENDLRQRIEQLERRQTQDDTALNVVNRYWNHLNDEIRLVLQRFDSETTDELENKNENESTTKFIQQLSTWDRKDSDDKLLNKVQVSRRAVGKCLQIFDRLMQRSNRITRALVGESGDDCPEINEDIKNEYIKVQNENKLLHSESVDIHRKYHTQLLKVSELQDEQHSKDTEIAELKNQADDLQYELDKVKHRNDKVENKLSTTIDKLKMFDQSTKDVLSKDLENNSTSGINIKELDELKEDIIHTREIANKRLEELNSIDKQYKENLKKIEELKTELKNLPSSKIINTTEYKCLQSQYSALFIEATQTKTLIEEANHNLELQRQNFTRQIEMMRVEEAGGQKKLRSEITLMENQLMFIRKEYETLRQEFEKLLAANEQTGPISREMRQLIISLQSHNKQLKEELMRYKRKYLEALKEKPKLKSQIEDLRKKLKQLHNEQCLTEKKEKKIFKNIKIEKEDIDIDKVKDESFCDDKPKERIESCDIGSPERVIPVVKEESGLTETLKVEKIDIKKDCSTPATSSCAASTNSKEGSKTTPVTGTSSGSTSVNTTPTQSTNAVPSTPTTPGVKINKEARIHESEIVRDLKAQLKKRISEQNEMKLLLNMYKGVSKEQKEKVQLMAAEKKHRIEIEDLKKHLRKIQDSKREERKKLADEDALRKIKHLEEQVEKFRKVIHNQKQEEETLLTEMEVTGQAFEDMQEKNLRLLQQLREKDDANFKLMSEKIQANQLHKLCLEEKDGLTGQVVTLINQIEATNIVSKKLEDKERILQSILNTIGKEMAQRGQAMELYKRKAIESAQAAADLKLHLEKYHAQVKESQQIVGEKSGAIEGESFKLRRLQEDASLLRRMAERKKKVEVSSNSDEVTLEQIREYKETLTCPSCKVKRKDAVLSKCFHVFCYDCLKTRYETRQRKCPKCNAAFGANDYHRLYLC